MTPSHPRAKWYNPTKDAGWNNYYKATWIMWGTLIAIIAGVIIIASLT